MGECTQERVFPRPDNYFFPYINFMMLCLKEMKLRQSGVGTLNNLW